MSMRQEPGVSESRAFARAQVVQQLHPRPDTRHPPAVSACCSRLLFALARVGRLHMSGALLTHG